MSKKMPFWTACVLIFGEERIYASNLSFYARNRFFALKAIEEMLPENPNLLDENGRLRDFRVMQLDRCNSEGEVPERFYMYSEIFQSVIGGLAGSSAAPATLRA